MEDLIAKPLAALVLAISLAAAALAGGACAQSPPPTSAAHAAAGPDSLVAGLESEIAESSSALTVAPQVIAELWQKFARDAEGAGGLVTNLGFLIAAAIVALAAERLVAIVSGWRVAPMIRAAGEHPRLRSLVWLVVLDGCGVAAMAIVFSFCVAQWNGGIPWRSAAAGFVLEILVRWRIAVLYARVVLRPALPEARIVALDDATARRFLSRFSSLMLAVFIVAMGTRTLQNANLPAGVAHLVGFAAAIVIFALITIAVIGGRRAAEAIVQGRGATGALAAVRATIARAWVGIAMAMLTVYMLAFLFALSFGLLDYFRAFQSSLGIVLVLVAFEALTAKAWQNDAAAGARQTMEFSVTRTTRFFTGVGILLAAFVVIAWIWITALQMSAEETIHARRTTLVVALTILFACLVWGFSKLAIDRHLQPTRPRGPGADPEEGEVSPASRLQTMLPFLRAALGIVIAVLAVLIVLSRMGIDTAPLIAGAGVFGLAISFGSQSLVRDIISGLFFIAEDAFRVGEYIDTGKLKGTVEGMSIRSLKLRHQNGALHTIPFGQLGAVSNYSRDWAITKFNIRLAIGTDIEQLRKLVKKIGQQLLANPEMAAEVIEPLKLQGIAEFADNAVVVRLKFTSRPAKSTWVMRQYLKRIYEELPKAGIQFATGAMTLLQGPMPGDLAAAAAGPTSSTTAAVVQMPPRESAPRG